MNPKTTLQTLITNLRKQGALYAHQRFYFLTQRTPRGLETEQLTFVPGFPLQTLVDFYLNQELPQHHQKDETLENLAATVLYKILPRFFVFNGNLETPVFDHNHLAQIYSGLMPFENQKEQTTSLEETTKSQLQGKKLLLLPENTFILEEHDRGNILIDTTRYTKKDIVGDDVLLQEIQHFVFTNFKERVRTQSDRTDLSVGLVTYLCSCGKLKPTTLDLKTCGAVFKKDHIDIYLVVPSFALTDFREGHYIFPEVKIYTTLAPSGQASLPYLPERYIHPFVWSNHDTTYKICTDMDLCVQGITEPTDIIVTRMLHAKKILEKAFHQRRAFDSIYTLINNSDPVRRDYYARIKTTREEVIRQGIPITNEHEFTR